LPKNRKLAAKKMIAASVMTLPLRNVALSELF
jgi:hypothetical protein